MKFYIRKLLSEIKKWIDKKEIIVITGMRRVGKTTLLRHIYNEVESDNKVFLDIENPIVQKTFQEKDYNNVLLNLQPYGIDISKKLYIFLDEIQAMPEIVSVIKYLFDHHSVKFFLTGSSSFYLKNLFSESLSGRKVIFELFPLDFEEFLIFKGHEKKFYASFKEKDKHKNNIVYEKFISLYNEFLRYGGFPQVVLANTIKEKNVYLDDIFTSYFEKEVKSLGDFKDVRVIRDFILLLFQRIGSKVDITRLASELGITRKTIYSYLSFLEATYFISLVSPYSKSIDKEVSKGKKIYFCDTGIVNKYAGISSGSLFENSVFNLIRNENKVNYYQKNSGTEIDFILKDKKIALEIKENGVDQDLIRLSKLTHSLKLKEYYVITKKFNSNKGFIPVIEL